MVLSSVFSTRFTPLLLTLAALTSAGSSLAAEKERPALLKSLESRGLSIVQEFDPGNGLRGFAGMAGQQVLAVYVLPDGSGIVGSRLAPDGRNLDEERLQEMVAQPMSDKIWAQLASSTWVQDGKDRAPRIVYTFSDPNCPYCNRFWQAARPWVDAGKVQLRHVMVGVIRADSSTKAAAILGAKDRPAALLQNERQFAQGGIKPAAQVSGAIQKMLDSNQALMSELGFRGTPGIVYRDEKNQVQQVNGMPQADALRAVMGPR